MAETEGTEPNGELTLRTLAMPADTNPSGDIFGGWIMSLMDLAGGMKAARLVEGRVVTVAVSRMVFMRPVKVGDQVCCYAALRRVGRTSMTLDVETWVLRQSAVPRIKVTEAEFTYVAVDANGRPRPITLAPESDAPAT
jgi:acyl-CoA thioesterase YciA